jgi:hypothetical protein
MADADRGASLVADAVIVRHNNDVMRLFFVLLVAVSATTARAQNATCQRPCLAPPVIAGAAPEERIAIEGALLRTLSVERCRAADLIDEACFDDDSCLLARTATPAGVIGARGVVVVGHLSARLASIREADDTMPRRVQRTTIEQPLLAFLANGQVDNALASCGAPVVAPVAPALSATAPEPPAPPTATTPASTVPWPALSIGGIVAGSVLCVVGGAVALGSASSLQRDLDSDVEKAAEAGLGGGALAGVVGLLLGTASVVALIVTSTPPAAP